MGFVGGGVKRCVLRKKKSHQDASITPAKRVEGRERKEGDIGKKMGIRERRKLKRKKEL